MTRRTLLLAVALAPALASAGQTPSFRASTDLVEVTAVVRDPDGQVVRGVLTENLVLVVGIDVVTVRG